jgi:hypothetical protein
LTLKGGLSVRESAEKAGPEVAKVAEVVEVAETVETRSSAVRK